MTIKIHCPNCGQKYELGEEFAGQEVTCEKCGAPFTVKPSPVPEPPKSRRDLTNCYACGGLVHIKAATCPHCGNPRSGGGASAAGIVQILLLLVGFPVVVGLVATYGGLMNAVIAAIWCSTLIICLKK